MLVPIKESKSGQDLNTEVFNLNSKRVSVIVGPFNDLVKKETLPSLSD